MDEITLLRESCKGTDDCGICIFVCPKNIFVNSEDPNGRAIPHPTTYVIDMEGVVQWKMTEVNYRIRPENEDILRELAALY